MLSLNNSTLGIDLGQRALKGISLVKSKNNVVLDQFFIHDLLESSQDFPETERTFDALSAIVNLNHLAKAKTITGISNKQVDSFDVLIPRLPSKEVRTAIRHEVVNHITYPIEKCSFDYLEIGSISTDPQKNSEQKLKVFHCHTDPLNEVIRKLKSIQLKPTAFDIDALATTATLKFNNYLEKNKIYVSIDLGESHTTISLISNQQLIYFNNVPASFGTINTELAKKHDLNYKDGEEIKFKIPDLLNKNDVSEVESTAEKSYLGILESIYETINYYLSQMEGVGLSEIFVMGGGSQDQFLLNLVEQKYETKITRVNPFRNIDIFKTKQDLSQKINEIAPIMSLAVGLALWEIDNK